MSEHKANEAELALMLQLKTSLDALHAHLAGETDLDWRADFARTASGYVTDGIRTVTGIVPAPPASPIVAAFAIGLEAFAAALKNEPTKDRKS